MDLLHNETLEDCDLNAKIKHLCCKYLTAYWNVDENEIKSQKVIVNKFKMNSMNKVYSCHLSNSKVKPVVIKLYAGIQDFLHQPLEANICYLLSGERELGPKVLGIFDGGIITEFFGDRNFSHEIDDANVEIVQLLATKMAQFHAQSQPVMRSKTKIWLDSTFHNLFQEDFFIEYIQKQLADKIKEYGLDILLTTDIYSEWLWIEKTIISFGSPIVFAAIDINASNVLLQENPLEIRFCDFDFAGYMYRGVDLGYYFVEWGMQDDGTQVLPTDDEMDVFLSAYRKECISVWGDVWSHQTCNSAKRLRDETKLFNLYTHLFGVIFCCWFGGLYLENESLQDRLKEAESQLKFYLMFKEKLMQEGIVEA